MVSLRKWIILNGAFSSLLVVIFTLVAFVFISVRNIKEDREAKREIVISSANTLETALRQNNRPLIENVLSGLQSRYQESVVSICIDEQTVFVYGATNSSCSVKKKLTAVTAEIRGFSNAKLILITNPLYDYRMALFYLFSIVLLLSGQMLIFIRLYKRISTDIIAPILGLSSENIFLDKVKITELSELGNNLSAYRSEIERTIKERAIVDVAAKVSHDIRSPLGALEMILPSLEGIPYEKKVILRSSINRIRDIANDLLNRYRSKEIQITEWVNTQETELLSTLVESLASEKRIEFLNLPHIEISSQIEGAYGIFSKLNSNDFKRVLSNLINNSIEAMPNRVGKVKISLSLNMEDSIWIMVQDSGIGIPKEVLEKIGEKGVSFDKPSGSGLGLSSAKETVQSWGGALEIESKVGSGTIVKIKLKRAETPAWFASKITLSGTENTILLDDDFSIHQAWRQRLEPLKSDGWNANLLCFSSPTDFIKYYRAHFVDLDDCLFLFDFEFTGLNENGLDIIERLGIQKQSILVTNRFEDDIVRNRCERLGVKLVPKPILGFVPIELV